MSNINKNYDVFTPSGDENVGDYSNFKLKVFRTVPENSRLLCKNIFTGKFKIKESGLRIIFPWLKSKFVTCASKPLDLAKIEYKTNDGIIVTIDCSISVRISNPINFEVKSMAPVDEMYAMLKEIIREFVVKRNFEELFAGRFSADDIGASPYFDEFGEKYGLKIDRLYIKDVMAPTTVKDDLEKNLSQRLENQRKISEADTAITVALKEKEIAVIKGTANGTRLVAIYNELINAGMSNEAARNIMNSIVLSENGSNLFASLNENGLDNNGISMSKIIAAVKAAQSGDNEKINGSAVHTKVLSKEQGQN